MVSAFFCPRQLRLFWQMVGNCAVVQSENTAELKGKRIAFQQTIITDEKSKHGHEDTGRLKAVSESKL